MALHRLHALLGVVPILAFLVLHVVETASAHRGRAGFYVTGGGGLVPRAIEVLLVLLPLGAHVVLGIRFAVRRERAPSDTWLTASARALVLQRVTGALAAAFVLAHVIHTWSATIPGLAPARFAYHRLVTDLGEPAFLVAYAAGLVATFLHVDGGIPLALGRLGLIADERGARVVRLATHLALAGLFIVSASTLAHFAVGRGFVPLSR